MSSRASESSGPRLYAASAASHGILRGAGTNSSVAENAFPFGLLTNKAMSSVSDPAASLNPPLKPTLGGTCTFTVLTPLERKLDVDSRYSFWARRKAVSPSVTTSKSASRGTVAVTGSASMFWSTWRIF